MALLDLLSENFCVGSVCFMPANFLDVGGGASQQRVYQALKLILELNPKGVFINIFGGITRCDIVASAIVQTLKELPNLPPIAIRLTGTNEKEGI